MPRDSVNPGFGAISTVKIGGVHHQVLALEAGTADAQDLVGAANPLPIADAAVQVALASMLAAQGGDGASAPAIPGTGIRGWLRSIYDKLAGTISVTTAAFSKGQRTVASTASAATLGSLCSGAALPAGATKVLLTPTADIWWRDDGVPSVGGSTSARMVAESAFTYDMDKLSALQVIGVATIYCVFYA